jgi:PAS domain S-box-containing protein
MCYPQGDFIIGDDDRLLSMVNASGDSFWETDVERRFVHVNDNMCRMMGYPREELRGRSVLEFMTPEYKAEVVRHTEKRAAPNNPLTHTGPIRHEGEFFRADGSKLWIETVSVPVFDVDRDLLASDSSTRHLVEPMNGGVHCRPDGAASGMRIKLGWAYNESASDPPR